MNDSSLESFVPAVLQLCGGDPDRIRALMNLAMSAATAAAANTANTKAADLITGEKVWASLQMINGGKITRPGPGRWKQLAPDIKEFLARAGKDGAPGCRTEPDQNDRKKYSGSRPQDGFTQEEADLILQMARIYGRTPTAIRQKWIWRCGTPISPSHDQ